VRLQTREQIRIPRGRVLIAKQVTSQGGRACRAAAQHHASVDYIPFPSLHRVTRNNSLSTTRDDTHRVAGYCQYLRIWEPANETSCVPSVPEATQVTSFESNRGTVDLGLRLRSPQAATQRRVLK